MFVTGHAIMTPQDGNLSLSRPPPFGMIGAGMRQSSPRMGRGMFTILIAIMNKDAMPCHADREEEKSEKEREANPT